MQPRHALYAILLLTTLPTACKKSAFLDARPDSSISVPTSIADCQALMDNDGYPGVRDKGLLRLEGKTYIDKDGDVLVIRHS